MKVALSSFVHSCNYGTLLQAFALAYKVKELGFECEYLDFRESGKNSRGIRMRLGSYY